MVKVPVNNPGSVKTISITKSSPISTSKIITIVPPHHNPPATPVKKSDPSSLSKKETKAVVMKKEVAKKIEPKRDSAGSAAKRHSEDYTREKERVKEKEKEKERQKDKDRAKEREVMELREKLRKRLSDTLYARVKEVDSVKLSEAEVRFSMKNSIFTLFMIRSPEY